MEEQGSDYPNLFSILESQNPAIKDGLNQMRRQTELTKAIPLEPVGWIRTAAPSRDMHYYAARGMAKSSSPVGDSGFRRKTKARVMWRISPFVLLLISLIIGIVALGIVIGPSVFRFVVRNWRILSLCIGAACIGASIVFALSRICFQPIKKIEPPSADTDEPLKELEGLANRTVARLRTAYTVQVSLVVAIFIGFAAIVTWSMVMVSQKRLEYACVFGSGGVAMFVLSRWKWQPFERMAEARRLADQADILSTALRMRIRTIEQISDPAARAKAQWEAAAEYLKLS